MSPELPLAALVQSPFFAVWYVHPQSTNSFAEARGLK
jgi:hypothetical protein